MYPDKLPAPLSSVIYLNLGIYKYNINGIGGIFLFQEIFDLIIKSAENAFIEVTVFVGAVLILFGYVDFKLSGRLVKKIEESKKIQPIIGSFLGLTPGCGGAIFVMPLFPKGTVSFGTIVATLIATMGDSAFVLMSVMPFEYILVSIISFIVAILTGYIIDYFNFGDRLLEKFHSQKRIKSPLELVHEDLDHTMVPLNHIGHEEGDQIDLILHHTIRGHQEHHTIGYRFTHGTYKLYWIVIAIGLGFGILDLFQVDLNNLFIPNLGTILGVSGTALSIIMMIMSKKFIQSDTHEESELKSFSLKETVIHSAQETAFVATWVFFAYLVYELFILVLGSGNYGAGEAIITSFLSQTGLSAVLIGVLVGIIPGCGPQIILVTLYTKGLIPFAALLANAISQDGDALFPLIAIDKRSALWATVFSTIPALVVGLVVYLITT